MTALFLSKGKSLLLGNQNEHGIQGLTRPVPFWKEENRNSESFCFFHMKNPSCQPTGRTKIVLKVIAWVLWRKEWQPSWRPSWKTSHSASQSRSPRAAAAGASCWPRCPGSPTLAPVSPLTPLSPLELQWSHEASYSWIHALDTFWTLPTPRWQAQFLAVGIQSQAKHSSWSAHCWWEGKMVWPLWKTIWWILTKLNRQSPCDPAVPLPGTHPKEPKAGSQRHLCTPNIRDSIIHNGQKAKTTQVYFNGWMDKQNGGELLLSHKKEWGSDTWYDTDGLWHYAKWSKSDTKQKAR